MMKKKEESIKFFGIVNILYRTCFIHYLIFPIKNQKMTRNFVYPL